MCYFYNIYGATMKKVFRRTGLPSEKNEFVIISSGPLEDSLIVIPLSNLRVIHNLSSVRI